MQFIGLQSNHNGLDSLLVILGSNYLLLITALFQDVPLHLDIEIAAVHFPATALLFHLSSISDALVGQVRWDISSVTKELDQLFELGGRVDSQGSSRSYATVRGC